MQILIRNGEVKETGIERLGEALMPAANYRPLKRLFKKRKREGPGLEQCPV